MINRPTAGKSSSSYRAPSGLYKAIVSRVVGVDVYVTVPRMTDDFEHGPIPYSGPVPTVGAETYVGFLEGRPDDVVAVFSPSSGVAPVVPTFLVASSLARQEMKDAADYVCTGTNDEVVINEAIGDLPAAGGTIQFTEGPFEINITFIGFRWVGLNVQANNVVLRGAGNGTVFNIHAVSQAGNPFQHGIWVGGDSFTIVDVNIDCGDIVEYTDGIALVNFYGNVTRCTFSNIGDSDYPGTSYIFNPDWGSKITDCNFLNFWAVTKTNLQYAIYQPTSIATISGCHFDGEFVTTDGGVGAYAIYGPNMEEVVIDDNHFFGIQALSGTFQASTFSNNIISVEDEIGIFANLGTGAVITGNVFELFYGVGSTGVGIKTDYTYGASITNNSFYSAQLTSIPIDLRGRTEIGELTISGNYFGGAGVAIASGINGEEQEIRELLITDNMFSKTTIDLGLQEKNALSSYFLDISITGNRFIHPYNIASTVPLVGIYLYSATLDWSGSVVVSDNRMADWYGSTNYGVEIETNLTGVNEGSTEVSRNTLIGTAGIRIHDGGSVTVAGNQMPHGEGAVIGDFADAYSSQISVEGTSEYAFVENNNIAMGDAGDTTGKGAVIYVEASDGGKVFGNTVTGHIAGTVDTAIEANGPLFVSDNHYLGVGTRWASAKTPLTNELVIGGTGAILGANTMKTNTSGATTPTFRNLRQIISSYKGVLAVDGGVLRIPFFEDAELVSVTAMVSTAPTGAPILVDIHLGSGSDNLFTTQGDRPTILASAFDSGPAYPNVTAISAGSYITVDIDQIGSIIAGADLTLSILWRQA